MEHGWLPNAPLRGSEDVELTPLNGRRVDGAKAPQSFRHAVQAVQAVCRMRGELQLDWDSNVLHPH